MNYENIIRANVTTDDFRVSKKFVADQVLAEIRRGDVLVFQYEDTLWLVDKEGEMPEIHFYTMGLGHSLRKYYNSFMRDLWNKTSHKIVYARTKNENIARFLELFDWAPMGIDQNGYAVYSAKRSS